MAKDTRVSKVNLTRLRRLLQEGEEDQARIDPAEERSWALSDCLADALPFDADELAEVHPNVRRLLEGLPRLKGEALGDLVFNPASSIADLEAAKDYAKQAGTTAHNEYASEAARVVYYAAIAAALVFHEKKISQYSHAQLQAYFASLIEKEWIVVELRELFTKAQNVCARKGRPAPDEGPT